MVAFHLDDFSEFPFLLHACCLWFIDASLSVKFNPSSQYVAVKRMLLEKKFEAYNLGALVKDARMLHGSIVLKSYGSSEVLLYKDE